MYERFHVAYVAHKLNVGMRVLALTCECMCMSQVNTKYLRQAGGGKLSNGKDIWGRLGSETAKTCPLEVMMLTGKETYWPLLIMFIFHAFVPQAGNSTESTLAVAQPSLSSHQGMQRPAQNICSPFSETRKMFKIWIFNFTLCQLL